MYVQANRARIATRGHTAGPNRRVDLVYHSSSDDTDDPEEVMLSIRGFLVKAELPPVTSRTM